MFWLVVFLTACWAIVAACRTWRNYRTAIDHDLAQLDSPYPISHVSERRPQ